MRTSLDCSNGCPANGYGGYQHRHCINADCDEILPLTDGYDGAVICAGCGDDFMMLCESCAAKNPYCPACTAERAACPKECAECLVGAV